MTFSCRSDNGYPEPNVYWINRTDNTRLSQSDFNITQHPDGTYSVLSTLKVNATSDMQLECFIENKVLQENTSANCKFLRDTFCFLDSRYINQYGSVCRDALTRGIKKCSSSKKTLRKLCFSLSRLSYRIYSSKINLALH